MDFQFSTLAEYRVGILWFGMVVGVVFCLMLRTEFHTDQSTGFVRLLSLPVYFGATWLPLLMLVPYAILLNPEWQETLSSNLYKTPLVMGWLLGLLIVMTPKIIMTLGISIPQKEIDNSQLLFDNTINTINSEISIQELLKYSLDEDERIRNAALVKIKAHKDWEGELIKILEKKSHYDFYWVYVFLDSNKIEHPERFIEPINKTIPVITSEIQEILKKSFLYKPDLEILPIDGICRVLDDQFKGSSTVFRPNILKLREALETPPLEQSGTNQEFVEILKIYRLAVKNWLDMHEK